MSEGERGQVAESGTAASATAEAGNFKQIVQYSPNAIVVLDTHGIVRFVNPAGEVLFLKTADEMVGKPFGYPIKEDGEPQRISISWPDRDPWIVEMLTWRMETGSETLLIANLHNVTEHVLARERMREWALIDELTGLHNRRGFLLLVEEQLRLADRNKRGMQLLFADVDGLKVINDKFGHGEGDRALVEIAGVLEECFRKSDILARLGGDEFVVTAVDVRRNCPELLKGRLQKCLDERNTLPGRRYRLEMSIGVVRYDPEYPCNIDALLALADEAMYQEKRARFPDRR